MPNDKRPAIYDENLNFFRNLILQARLVWLLMLDPRVPLWMKGVPVGAVGYAFLPTDIIPDFIPILGQLDDLAVILLGMRLFIEMAPAGVVAEHMAALKGDNQSWEVQHPAASTTPAQKNRVDSDDLESTVIEGTYTEPPQEAPKE